MTAILIILTGLSIGQTDEARLVNSLLQAKTDKYWTYDRSSNQNIISCASTGLGFVAYSRAVKLGILSKKEAVRRIRDGFDSLREYNKDNRGWLYHWMSVHGDSAYNHEISSIDTVLFYLGAEKAAEELNDEYLLKHIKKAKALIDVKFMLDSEGYFRHGFIWKNNKPDWFEYSWKEYSEGILIYKYFGVAYKPTKIKNSLPLFVYNFPLIFYPSDEGRQYLENAVNYQIRTYGTVGFSSCDTPRGYEFFPTDVVSPISLYCAGKFSRIAAEYSDKLEIDKLTPAFSLDRKWISHDDIYLDMGIALLITRE